MNLILSFKIFKLFILRFTLQISQGVGAAISSSLNFGGPLCTVNNGTQLLPPPPPPPPSGSVPPPPPPPLIGLNGFPAPPGAPPLLMSGVPQPPGAPFVQLSELLPSFVKPKKKYNPEMQMKRANWIKVTIVIINVNFKLRTNYVGKLDSVLPFVRSCNINYL